MNHPGQTANKISFTFQRYVVNTDRSGEIHVTVQVSVWF